MNNGQIRAVLRDAARKTWLEFSSPCRCLIAHRVEQVLPLIRQIEAGVRQNGWHAAGFISYEAAPAFDPSLPAKADGEFPLLWFGLFERANEISLPDNARESRASIPWQPSVTPEEYRRCLRKVREYIRRGHTYQVNFTYRLRAVTKIDPWRLFLQLAADGETPFAAFIDTGDWAICSASPELFLRLDGQRLESRPMKGTAARGLWCDDDQAQRRKLSCSEKDRAENVMIVDMVRNDLGRVAHAGSVTVPALFQLERYPTVWQLTSTVAAETDEPLDRILRATFPPASVTGAPKRRTMEIIAELETSPRRIYCGAIGFVAPDRRAQFNVAIRTVLLHKPTGRAEYGVGGGIVWDSKPPDEYAECVTKSAVLKHRSREFDLLETLRWSPGSGYWLLEYHLKRLARSAEYFGFEIDGGRVESRLRQTAAGLPAGPHRVRLLVSRRGNVRCEVAGLEAGSMCFGDIALAKDPVDAQDGFLYHKTTRRAVYEAALRSCPGSEDVLLFNERGEVTESTVANLAIELDGVLWTPPVRCGLLAGTQRAWLFDRGRLRERVITVQEALESPAVYLLNSVRGMHRVRIGIEARGGTIADGRRPMGDSSSIRL